MNMPNVNETVDVHPVFPWLTAARRAWMYRVLTAGAALAAMYGIVAENAAVGWVGFGAALLGSGTAVAHTPTTTNLRSVNR